MNLISIILPAYNEGKNLKHLLPDIFKNLEKYNLEIILIDDGSADCTKDIVIDLNLVYKYNKQRQGLAKSIKMGIESARGEIIIVMDSDGDHNPLNLPFMIEELNFYDVVSTSRFLNRSKVTGRIRSSLSKAFNSFVRFMTGGELTDYLYGNWAIKKSTLEKINFNNIFWGYGDYCIRLLFYFEKLNLKILEIPSLYGKRLFGDSNLRPIKIFGKYTFAVFKLVLMERFLHVRKNKILSNL